MVLEPGTKLEIRIVIDFELAAINAVKQIFPRCTLEGCSWHPLKAWVRNRNKRGVFPFLKGRRRTPRTESTASGPEAPSLLQVSGVLPQSMLDGPFQYLWCKYMFIEQRTTNMAENYHGRLRKIFGGRKYPKFEQLVLALQSVTAVTETDLMNLGPTGQRAKKLRPETSDDMKREMSRFTSDKAI
ncbi:hypothetical protein Aduo_018940 [Ancylostoma duodenale]